MHTTTHPLAAQPLRALIACTDEPRAARLRAGLAALPGAPVECTVAASAPAAAAALASGRHGLCLAEAEMLTAVERQALAALDALIVLADEPFEEIPGVVCETIAPACLGPDTLASVLRLALACALERGGHRRLRDELPLMLFSLDAGGGIRSVNRAAAERLGYSGAELTGTAFSAICLDMSSEELARYLRRVLDSPNEVLRLDTTLLTRDHRPLSVEQSARPVAEADGSTSALVICQDNSEARRLSEALSYSESHDALTGLFNRQCFEQVLARLSAEARWNEQQHVLVYMDIDQFKVVNDVSGHGAGDELIRQVAGVLKDRVRRGDVLARLGGDEFALVLVDCPMEHAYTVTESLREGLAALRFNHNGRLYRITASFGMVGVSGADANVAMTLGKADTACYTAKEAGRNRVHLFTADSGDALRRRGEMEWVSRVNDALENDRLVLFAQGIYSLHDPEQPPGYEILVRLVEGETIVAPGMFLSAVERFNLSGEVDRRVIEKLVAWSAQHPQFLERISRWSVNLSGATLSDAGFSDWLKAAFASAALPPSKVCFEITETATISDIELACEFIGDMKALGFRFALDDFGSGLSSFAYLKELPVNTVKIDGIFIRDILESPVHRAMVRSITEIAHLMGKSVVGEFVETEEVAAMLRSLGVDAGQGFGLSRPAAIDELLETADKPPGKARSAA